MNVQEKSGEIVILGQNKIPLTASEIFNNIMDPLARILEEKK